MIKAFHWEPLDTAKQVWTAKYRLPTFISRSIAFLSKEKQLLVVGPGSPLVDTLPPALANAGPPAMALIPNSYHYLGISAWMEHYPNLIAVASSQAMGRLKNKGYKNIQELELFKKVLPDNISILEPKGLGYGEVWLRVRYAKEVIWIVCDTFFNYARFSRKPIARTLQWLMQAAPGLKMSSIVKYFLIKDKKLFQNWFFQQLKEDHPTILVPAHGEVLRSPELSMKLKELVLKRL